MQRFTTLLDRPIVRRRFMRDVPEMIQRWIKMLWRFARDVLGCPEDVLETQRDAFEMHQRRTKNAQEMPCIQHVQDIHLRCTRDALEMHLQRHPRCIVVGSALDIHLNSSEMQLRCARGASKIPLVTRCNWDAFEVIRNSVSCFKSVLEMELGFA